MRQITQELANSLGRFESSSKQPAVEPRLPPLSGAAEGRNGYVVCPKPHRTEGVLVTTWGEVSSQVEE